MTLATRRGDVRTGELSSDRRSPSRPARVVLVWRRFWCSSRVSVDFVPPAAIAICVAKPGEDVDERARGLATLSDIDCHCCMRVCMCAMCVCVSVRACVRVFVVFCVPQISRVGMCVCAAPVRVRVFVVFCVPQVVRLSFGCHRIEVATNSVGVGLFSRPDQQLETRLWRCL